MGDITYSLLAGVRESLVVGINSLSLDLIGPSTVVSQDASDHSNVVLGQRDGLSVVQRLDSGKGIKVLLDQLGELDEKLATVLWADLRPWSFERGAGSLDGNVDILLGGLGDGANNLG